MKSLSVLAFCLVSSAASAESLTVGQCVDIYNGLLSLSAPPPAPAYKFGAARMTIALNIAALRPIAEALESARKDLVVEAAEGKEINPNSTIALKLGTQYEALRAKSCEVQPGRIKAADLKLGDDANQNAILPSVIAVLIPILDQ